MSAAVAEKTPPKQQDLKPGQLVKLGPNDPVPQVAALQIPAVGRIVHFKGAPVHRRHGQEWHAAIVVGGEKDHINLKVLFDGGTTDYFEGVAHESKSERLAWRWPPRT